MSEYLRKEGFDDICYKSSLTGEKSYTLFCGPQEETYPFFKGNDIPTEFTEWLYLVEYTEGVINNIGYKDLIDPRVIDITENPIPSSEEDHINKDLF
ncbi:hypothetical protein [Peribacillus loiseleuriae]|uniref:Uncharacterized protein n=1 Tax=Peribacillus loiseleuriae TaxID=1679170 RepID=A0A0K9GTZ0_9BACI|nr:hypothetical protein [Peribacillus loiseleuriae]KMY50111.1 hypothetical protein AC625_11860 [Peribacillus loiseleuriae]